MPPRREHVALTGRIKIHRVIELADHESTALRVDGDALAAVRFRAAEGPRPLVLAVCDQSGNEDVT